MPVGFVGVPITVTRTVPLAPGFKDGLSMLMSTSVRVISTVKSAVAASTLSLPA